MFSLFGSLLSWFLGLFGSSTRKDEIALGQAQQQNVDHKADIAVIAQANRAAQTASEIKAENDENNLDRSL